MGRGRYQYVGCELSKALDCIRQREKLSKREAELRAVEHIKISEAIEKFNPMARPVVTTGFDKDKRKVKRFKENFGI